MAAPANVEPPVPEPLPEPLRPPRGTVRGLLAVDLMGTFSTDVEEALSLVITF